MSVALSLALIVALSSALSVALSIFDIATTLAECWFTDFLISFINHHSTKSEYALLYVL